MADKYSPGIMWAKDAATRFNKDEVVVLLIDDLTGLIDVYSYGKTGKKCKHADKVGNVVYEAVVKAYREGSL